ncbi:hypothetical protein SDC9_144997 [bioreactor metagenome]|uniref:Uncharacterized protein n=1 Tax=bioreactor metagenome TaxID=1076179 RepID=A0A645E7J8_9ZZZZ
MRGHAQILQYLQRRRAQQRGEPAVEGADLHRPAAVQRLAVKRGKRCCLLLHPQGIDAARQQFLFQLVLGLACKIFQPFLQALAHFTSGLLGEGDGQNFMRLGAVEQGPQHARDQHPCLASARAGLHGHAALRVAGNRIERLTRHRLAVVLIGWRVRGIRHRRHAQESLRHKPRAAQYPQTAPSPKAGIGAPCAMRAMSLCMPASNSSRRCTTSSCS